jgi:hypothetical protein
VIPNAFFCKSTGTGVLTLNYPEGVLCPPWYMLKNFVNLESKPVPAPDLSLGTPLRGQQLCSDQTVPLWLSHQFTVNHQLLTILVIEYTGTLE